MGSPQARQGLGDASGEQGRGMTGRGSAQQPAQGPGQAADSTRRDAPRLPAPEAGAIAPQGKAAKAKQPPGPGPRIAMRNWRISTRLVSLLALPVVAATTLGAFRIEDSWRDIQQQDNMKLLTELTQQATTLAAQIQEERDESAGLIVRDGNASDPDVKYSRKLTDTALQRFREATDEIDATDDSSLKGVNSTLKRIVVQLNELSDIRKNAYQNNEYDSQTVKAYGDLVDSLLSLSQDMAQATSNSDMIQATRALAVFSSAKENASIQRAIIAAALAQKPADLSEADRLEALSAQRAEDNDLDQFEQLYAGESSATDLTAAMDKDTSIQQADRYARDILKDAGGLKRTELKSYKDWSDLDSVKLERMGKIEQTLLQEMEQKSRQLRNDAERDAIINGALIILVLGVSLAGAFIVARSMVRSLRRLQDTAETVSNKRLPELVKQLSEADPEDVDTSVESVGVHSKDEIGKVAQAFDEVHREAVRLAAEQALLRGNVNAMFTNLSRRSQGLIQRQLSLISELESREADPDQLASLFKLDHLATRMRRNGENLLVLAGEEPGRRWTRPVPLVDVLRAAASEVEQYERIELSAVPATQVAGRVVNDLVHLLAELLENATSFSSPQTKVKVTGHALPDGRVLVEIHDTGIGLSPEDLAAINERLASPPTVDVSVSRRMGLFVVGRLSLRHGIRIQLRPSDSGGTTALVMLPVDVTQSGTSGPAKGGQAGQGGDKPGAGKGGPTNRLGAVPPRGQLGQGSGPAGNRRPALPARGDSSGPGGTGPGGPGKTGPGGPAGPGGGQQRSGLPTRPVGGSGQAPGTPDQPSSSPAPFAPQASRDQGQGQGQGPITPPHGTPVFTPPHGTP
ncbi:sensor histidine kinase, partial [Streptomyces sp. A7024]|nr:sensor histidine kinase [Streptomyces coryli]